MVKYNVILLNKAGEAKLLKKSTTDINSLVGARFGDIDKNVRNRYNLWSGVQIIELYDGLLNKSVIKAEYIITHINEIEIFDVNDIYKFISATYLIEGLYAHGRYIVMIL